jgi:hypothetical protein
MSKEALVTTVHAFMTSRLNYTATSFMMVTNSCAVCSQSRMLPPALLLEEQDESTSSQSFDNSIGCQLPTELDSRWLLLFIALWLANALRISPMTAS